MYYTFYNINCNKIQIEKLFEFAKLNHFTEHLFTVLITQYTHKVTNIPGTSTDNAADSIGNMSLRIRIGDTHICFLGFLGLKKLHVILSWVQPIYVSTTQLGLSTPSVGPLPSIFES